MKNLFYKIKKENNHLILKILGIKFKFRLNDNITKINYCNNNKIIIHCSDVSTKLNPPSIKGLTINFYGQDNTIEIFEPCNFDRGVELNFFGNSANVKFYKCRLVECRCFFADNAIFNVDEGSSVGGRINMHNEDSLKVIIGKNCMFSHQVELWATDRHYISDLKTNKCVNAAQKGIIIGDNIWVGFRAAILKDVSIADGCIIGAMSVITHDLQEENSIYAGNPARKIKTNIKWGKEAPRRKNNTI